MFKFRYRYYICHAEPYNAGSEITRCKTRRRAKAALKQLRPTIPTKIRIWDNRDSKWLSD